MKKIVFVLSMAFFGIPAAEAQYYYRDIISNNQLRADMAKYKANKIRTITIKSYEDDGSESEGFFCERRISKDYKKAELFTRSDVNGISLFTSWFDEKGRLLETNDSSTISVTNIRYAYDNADKITSIHSTIRSSDDDFTNEITEEHLYFYNDRNQPEKMIRVKNNTDSTVILFGTDDNQNISIEKDTRNASKYYYYYDEKNRLTDVVHFNEYKQKLLPDYLFEYNSAGLIVQMTSTEEGGSDYYTWKYSYENGLRTREKCYSKEKKLMGSVEYEYK